MHDLKAIRFIEGTKVSHDYQGNVVNTFSYRQLCEAGNPAIGIPCRQNCLMVIDVDVPGVKHQKDGRPFWSAFCRDYGVPDTYVVRTPGMGYHFYFRLPESVNPETFNPPAEIGHGCDIKWNGWVGAPPSKGYEIVSGNLTTIATMPPQMMAYIASLVQNKPKPGPVGGGAIVDLHRPFSPSQIEELRKQMQWMQTNASLSRAEWRDGLFALKAGCTDEAVLDELTLLWTMNKAYVPGDEHMARDMVSRASAHGSIGPGSIFAIIKNVQTLQGVVKVDTPFTVQEIFDRAGIIPYDSKGNFKVEPSESNAAALIGGIFAEEDLYHDVRTDLYIFKGRSISDAELVNLVTPMIQRPTTGLGLEKFRKMVIASGLEILMAARQVDPHRRMLQSLVWDGKPRIETFFSDYFGVEDNEYFRAVGRNFWTALAGRGLQPGCKFDNMVVLEGLEGIRKSSVVEAIGGEYTFCPTKHNSLQDLDELRKMHQSVLVELPELLGLIGRPANEVKGFLSLRFDSIRALFARKAMKHPRGFVFIGTTNDAKYLQKDLGKRRFWPVPIPHHVRSINTAAISAHRDQLFAEGARCFLDGVQYHDVPKDYHEKLINERLAEEPLIGPIQDIARGLHEFSTAEMYRHLEAGSYVTRGFTAAMQTRIELALIRSGFDCTSDGRGGKKWFRQEVALASFI